MEINKLTPYERLSLVNQYRILAAVDEENAAEHNSKIEILESGYTIFYDTVFVGIDDEMEESECKYVFDILDMHRHLIQSFDELKDKAGLTAEDVRFKGFDGNNETKRYALAKFLKEEGRWEETLKDAPMNSHSMVTMNRYPRMLERWEPHKKKRGITSKWQLSADEIKDIIELPK